jgi:hypothetical protein
MNTKIVFLIIAASLVSAGWVSSAAAAPRAAAAPVDYRACHFRDGKTMKDLNVVTAKFRAYANKADKGYAAWTLTPQFQTDLDLDVAWLGAWPDSNAFGVSMERWMKEGGALRAEFDRVIDCSRRHMLAASLPINAPGGVPEDGMWLFYACNLNDKVSIDKAYAAHLEAGQVMKAMGSLSTSWMMVPAIGAGVNDPDYYHALAFYRYSDLGASLEMFVNEGGQQKRDAILNKVSSCATPVLFDAVSVRALDER